MGIKSTSKNAFSDWNYKISCMCEMETDFAQKNSFYGFLGIEQQLPNPHVQI